MLDTTFDAAEKQRAAEAGPGDVVTLKAGGPRMTVVQAGPVGFASGHWLLCEWFDEHGELRQDQFPQDVVRIEPRSIPLGSVRARHSSAVFAPTERA
jgi:uncharacterized protein YodC (DUF2158 family)